MKKMTHKEFMAKLQSKRNDVICEGTYCGSTNKIPFRCRKCGTVWLAKPSDILYGKGCPGCKNKKSHNEFVEEMRLINNSIDIIGKYVKDSCKILCRCKECGYEWYQTPNNLLNKKCGCPVCAAKKINNGNTLTHEEFLHKVE